MTFKKSLKIVLIILLIFIIVFSAYVIYDGNRVIIKRYKYMSEKVPEGFNGYRICLVTDFHNSSNYDLVYKRVSETKPDIICVGGDLVDYNTKDFTNAVMLIKKLSSLCDVYYTYGNHEMWSIGESGMKEPPIKDELKNVNVNFLNDKVVTLKKGKDMIHLVGYGDDIYSDKDDFFINSARPRLKSLYDLMDKRLLSILVFHRAQYFDEISDIGFDVVLAGHTHGGIIGIKPINDMILNIHFNNDKFSKGEYHSNNSTMFLTGGTVNRLPLYRVFNTPEVLLLELKSK